MTRINNIPQEILTEHVNWHLQPGNPNAGGRLIDPWPQGAVEPTAGSGEEFLVWHQGFLERFHQWVASLPEDERPDSQAIEPWTSIPIGLKMGMLGWNTRLAQEEAQLDNMWNFASLDELGRFLEWSLHGWLHGAAAGMWNEPVITSFESPRSTYFWQLHGLIDHWRQQWVDAHTFVRVPDLTLGSIFDRIDPELVRRLLQGLTGPVPTPPWVAGGTVGRPAGTRPQPTEDGEGPVASPVAATNGRT